MQRRQLGQMQDRPIAAKGDDQIRALQLRQQRLGGQVSKASVFGSRKGEQTTV